MKLSCLHLFFLLLLILSCNNLSKTDEINLEDFLGQYQKGDVLIYSYISQDGSKSEIHLEVGDVIAYEHRYCRCFYVIDDLNNDFHQFSLCADTSKGIFSVDEVINYSDKNLRPFFMTSWLTSSITLLKEPLFEGKEWREKSRNDKEVFHQVVQILHDTQTDELKVKVSYQEGGFDWYCLLSNKRGFLELTLSSLDLKTQKSQVIRKLKLEDIKRQKPQEGIKQ